MTEELRNGERLKRIKELAKIIDERRENYPYTWDTQHDLRPYIREHYELTRDDHYQRELEQKIEERHKTK